MLPCRMNSPPHDPQAASRLLELAPEVASTIVRVAGDIALVIGVDGVICQVAASGTPNGVRRVISVENIEPPRHEFLPCRAA